MKRDRLLRWLEEEEPIRLAELWALADETRRGHVGDEVHLRGLIEIGNVCERACTYCGLRRGNRALPRYRMADAEIVACAARAAALGYGTVVLQGGEDDALTVDALAGVITAIRSLPTGDGAAPLAVTLSVGERPEGELAAWRHAGADRYLLRFETSDRALYRRIHPDRADQRSDRPALLERLRALGYQIGSGVMVGIPGQTIDSLADDLELFRALELDMIGLGPYLPHPATPLGAAGTPAPRRQAAATALMTCKMLALARLVCPRAHIPATTALATLDRARGREDGLRRGANVWMPNLTPARYRAAYEVYPGKARAPDDASAPEPRDDAAAREAILALGRRVGTGRGDSPAWLSRQEGGTCPAYPHAR